MLVKQTCLSPTQTAEQSNFMLALAACAPFPVPFLAVCAPKVLANLGCLVRSHFPDFSRRPKTRIDCSSDSLFFFFFPLGLPLTHGLFGALRSNHCARRIKTPLAAAVGCGSPLIFILLLFFFPARS